MKTICLVALSMLVSPALLWAQDAVIVYPSGQVGVGTGSEPPQDPTVILKVAGRIQDSTGFVMPVGTILPYGGTAAPDGWLLCDGQAYLAAEYPDLFAVIGISFGNGTVDKDGNAVSENFNVPDLRGQFLRGANGGRADGKGDPDAAGRDVLKPGGETGDKVGSYQDDAFQGHRHQVNSVAGSGSGRGDENGSPHWSSWLNLVTGEPLASSYGAPRLSAETRPSNVYVNFIIKW